jgi:hypothetical protein
MPLASCCCKAEVLWPFRPLAAYTEAQSSEGLPSFLPYPRPCKAKLSSLAGRCLPARQSERRAASGAGSGGRGRSIELRVMDAAQPPAAALGAGRGGAFSAEHRALRHLSRSEASGSGVRGLGGDLRPTRLPACLPACLPVCLPAFFLPSAQDAVSHYLATSSTRRRRYWSSICWFSLWWTWEAWEGPQARSPCFDGLPCLSSRT